MIVVVVVAVGQERALIPVSRASKIRIPKAAGVAKKIRQRSKYYVPVGCWSTSLTIGDGMAATVQLVTVSTVLSTVLTVDSRVIWLLVSLWRVS